MKHHEIQPAASKPNAIKTYPRHIKHVAASPGSAIAIYTEKFGIVRLPTTEMTLEGIDFLDMHPVNSQLHAYTEDMLGCHFAKCRESRKSSPHQRTEEFMALKPE